MTVKGSLEQGEQDHVDEVAEPGRDGVGRLEDGPHGVGGLGEGEAEAGDAEHDLAGRHDDVLGQDQEHVVRVFLYDPMDQDLLQTGSEQCQPRVSLQI